MALRRADLLHDLTFRSGMRKLKRSLTKMKRSYLDVTPESEKAQINSKKYTTGGIRLTGNISQTSGIAVLPDDA
ncbi:hypothetical protein PQR62_07490 [Herbaspirillum lusitanum]|uniref:Uncharacterized protein n=1 Tax=Herbaspirillum lusitanum TaxID=213312 RepID=A0ABW9A5E1_9BURK